jgi:hypothetical protein
MNADVKKEWTAALLSGKYKQGQERLRTRDDKYCCLGVLCELAAEHGIIDPGERVYSGGAYVFGTEEDFSVSYLPVAVQIWAGIGTPQALLPNETEKSNNYLSLAHANDAGRSFKEIAELIEEYF